MNITRRASLRKTINSLDLSKAEEVLKSKYKYVPGKPGRPPCSPNGMFISFVLMFLRMETYRDFHAFLEKNHFWRKQLGFNKTPDIGTFSHFLDRIRIETFEQLFQIIVQQLLNQGFLSRHSLAIDGSIIKGNTDDKQAGWGWDHIHKCNVYGYKIHTIVDSKTELPLTLHITKANVHDSRVFNTLYSHVRSYDSKFKMVNFTADKAYDSSKIRKTLLDDNVKPIIKAAKTRIKPMYPTWFLDIYRRRTSVERFFSRLKKYLDLKHLHVYGKKSVYFFTYLFCIGMLLAGYINYLMGYSPRSVKTFLRKFT